MKLLDDLAIDRGMLRAVAVRIIEDSDLFRFLAESKQERFGSNLLADACQVFEISGVRLDCIDLGMRCQGAHHLTVVAHVGADINNRRLWISLQIERKKPPLSAEPIVFIVEHTDRANIDASVRHCRGRPI